MEGRGARSRRRAGPAWLATLAGALLLMTAGFAVGLVAGILFEEPGLVIDQIAGRATEVPLPGETPPAVPQTPDVAAAPTAEPDPAQPAASPQAEVPVAAEALLEPAPAPAQATSEPAASPPPPAVSSAPPPRSGYSVQVGAYGDEAGAQRLAESVGKSGFPVYVSTTAAKGARYRVRVGPVASRDEARQLAARLEREFELKTWVLSEAGPVQGPRAASPAGPRERTRESRP